MIKLTDQARKGNLTSPNRGTTARLETLEQTLPDKHYRT